MKTLHRLQPICKERIWGAENFATEMNIVSDCEKPGEIYCANALKGDDVLVDDQQPLSLFYKEHKKDFHLKADTFPLRVNLIKAEDDLSLQVHPNDAYAHLYENSRGLSEAWIILDEHEGSIRLGHRFQNRYEIETALHHNKVLDYIPKYDVTKDMFFYLPCGTIHAIGKGVCVYEISHMADITYRLYDYDRIDNKTHQKRKLHIHKALDNIYYPQLLNETLPITAYVNPFYKRIIYMDEIAVFTIEKIDVYKHCCLYYPSFCLITIVSGEGTINEEQVEKGQTFIKLYDEKPLYFKGNMSCIIATYKEA